MVRRQHGNSQEHITKHIFVTGGVVSSLGKGLTASSLGRLLRSRGIHVLQQKLDPYINVDPGTMNPFQHGEVYVTEDGAETDLDIGHYERFLDVFLSQKANVTTGQIYQEVLRKERAGEYLGQCVQVIPHITNEIKSRMRAQASDDVDVIITEIGGTVGDIESQPFLEAVSYTHLNQRSDTTAVPAASVVAEAMVRLTLARYALDKFGGDSVAETRRNFEQYVASWPEHMR